MGELPFLLRLEKVKLCILNELGRFLIWHVLRLAFSSPSGDSSVEARDLLAEARIRRVVSLGVKGEKEFYSRLGADKHEIGVGCILPRGRVALLGLFVNWLIVAARR
jgi:hypothetical protein